MGTLEIEGEVIWDTNKTDVVLSVLYILVKPGGRFELGTDENPMMNNAEIYIRKPSEDWHPKLSNSSEFGFHEDFGSRFFVGDRNSTVVIHGRPLNRFDSSNNEFLIVYIELGRFCLKMQKKIQLKLFSEMIPKEWDGELAISLGSQ